MEQTYIEALKQYLHALVMPEDIDDDIKKFINTQGKNFTLLNKTLYQLNQETYQHRKVLNREEAINAVYVAHQHPFGGHLAYNNTLNKVSTRYYWPNMTVDVMKYVKECPRCQRFVKKSLNERLHPIATKTAPFDQIEIDVNHLPISSDGSHYVIGAICMLTKYVELKPIKYQTTAEIAIFIYERIICAHATPSVIITDNGKPMVSYLIEKVCFQFSIIHKTGSPYNSQSQGLIERLNRTLNQVLRRRTEEEKRDWHAYLPAAQFSYNTLKHAATKQTPFYLLYGYNARTPFDVVHSLPTSEIGMDRLLEQRVARQIHTLAVIRKLCIKRIEASQKMQRERIDKKLLNRKRELKPGFKKGDLVEVFNHFTNTSWSGKLLDRWNGIFTVVQVLKKGSYVIEARKRNGDILQKIVHGNKLQKYVVPNVAWNLDKIYKKTRIVDEDVLSLSSGEFELDPNMEPSDQDSSAPVYFDFQIVGKAKRKRVATEVSADEEQIDIDKLYNEALSATTGSSDTDLALLEQETVSVPSTMNEEAYEIRLKQVYQSYKLFQQEWALIEERKKILVGQVGDQILNVMHSRLPHPINQAELMRYKTKRAEFLKGTLFVSTPLENEFLKPIKLYLRKHDFYELI